MKKRSRTLPNLPGLQFHGARARILGLAFYICSLLYYGKSRGPSSENLGTRAEIVEPGKLLGFERTQECDTVSELMQLQQHKYFGPQIDTVILPLSLLSIEQSTKAQFLFHLKKKTLKQLLPLLTLSSYCISIAASNIFC